MSFPDRIRELLDELETRIDKVENWMLACQGVPAFLDPMQRDWDHLVAARAALHNLLDNLPRCGHRYDDGMVCFLEEGHEGAHQVAADGEPPAWLASFECP